jgi:ketol-acid reductoisomerase
MGKILDEIRSGAFAKKWIDENDSGRKWFTAHRAKERHQTIESVGEKLRAMMPFLDPIKVEPND